MQKLKYLLLMKYFFGLPPVKYNRIEKMSGFFGRIFYRTHLKYGTIISKTVTGKIF